MTEQKKRSPFLLETAKGTIELTKGMYLSLIRRRALLGKDTSKKNIENEEDQARTTVKNSRNEPRKLIVKARTVKKASRSNTYPMLQKRRFVSLSKGLHRQRFQLYDDFDIFPQEIQQFQLPQNFDNDCQSDEEEINKSVKNVLMSLCVATYDSRWRNSN